MDWLPTLLAAAGPVLDLVGTPIYEFGLAGADFTLELTVSASPVLDLTGSTWSLGLECVPYAPPVVAGTRFTEDDVARITEDGTPRLQEAA